MVYRIRAEERMLSRDDGWSSYRTVMRYRLFPAYGRCRPADDARSLWGGTNE
jgi:hypothetical protein